MLSDAELALLNSIPDVTEQNDELSRYEACYRSDEWTDGKVEHSAWKRALDHANRLNVNKISFCVVKWCNNYYVLTISDAKKLGVDIS